ncbi:MAG: hypothetical protein ACR2QE_01945 [Acidimicrobiales bacterium]
MTSTRSRWLLAPLATVLLAAACSQPIEIVGEGDVVSATGEHDCSYEEHQAGAASCTENVIVGAYDETYTGEARPGWHFHRWVNYCTTAADNTCSFSVGADVIEAAAGGTVPPLIAVFRPDVITGFDSLFIGHSFFRPFAQGMSFHAPNAGFSDHTQDDVFAGGANGAPEALWNNAAKRAEIQGLLDAGDVDLFGMTYFPTYPSLTGYVNWFDYALAQNPDTRFFIAMPWIPDPGSYTAAQYDAIWESAHPAIAHSLVDDLRDLYPGVDIYGIPYGQAAVELYNLYDAGQLPDVDSLVSGTGDAIFSDAFGHADDILVELGRLVWLRAIYDVPLSSYPYDPGYTTDLKAIADAIMDEHDEHYDAP